MVFRLPARPPLLTAPKPACCSLRSDSMHWQPLHHAALSPDVTSLESPSLTIPSKARKALFPSGHLLLHLKIASGFIVCCGDLYTRDWMSSLAHCWTPASGTVPGTQNRYQINQYRINEKDTHIHMHKNAQVTRFMNSKRKTVTTWMASNRWMINYDLSIQWNTLQWSKRTFTAMKRC